MAERTEDVQAHWTRPGVLARIDAALTELGHDPQNLNPEILATLEHLHSGGLATTRRQANRIALTEDSRVLDVGCGIGGAGPGSAFSSRRITQMSSSNITRRC